MSCLRPLLIKPLSGKPDEYGDLVILHKERQLVRRSSVATPVKLVKPPEPAMGTLALGERTGWIS